MYKMKNYCHLVGRLKSYGTPFRLQSAVTVLLTFAQTIVRADLAQSSVRAIWFRLLTSAERGSGDPCRYFILWELRARKGQVQWKGWGRNGTGRKERNRNINNNMRERRAWDTWRGGGRPVWKGGKGVRWKSTVNGRNNERKITLRNGRGKGRASVQMRGRIKITGRRKEKKN